MKDLDYQALLATDRNKAADRLQAASVILAECGDNEIADTCRVLSAQMDFDDNDEACDIINKTREKLDRLIEERKKHHANLYIRRLTDEEILGFSSGEVTETDYSRINSSFVPNGLFDPKIFGGTGAIPSIKSTEPLDTSVFGTGMGHVNLPCYVVRSTDYQLIGKLLGIQAEDIKKIAECDAYVVLDPGYSDIPFKSIYSSDAADMLKKNKVRFGTGGDAIHELLEKLNYADKPERLAFKAVPVIAPMFRAMAYHNDTKKIVASNLNEVYVDMITTVNRHKRLAKLQAPEKIIEKECSLINRKVNILMDAVHKAYTVAFHVVKEKMLREQYISQLKLVERYRIFGFEPVKNEKTSDITSLDLYPQKITIRDKHGNVTTDSLNNVINACLDAIDDYTHNHSMEVAFTPEKQREDVDEEGTKRLCMLYDAMKAIWEGAEKGREGFEVIWDESLAIYIPYQPA